MVLLDIVSILFHVAYPIPTHENWELNKECILKKKNKIISPRQKMVKYKKQLMKSQTLIFVVRLKIKTFKNQADKLIKNTNVSHVRL